VSQNVKEQSANFTALEINHPVACRGDTARILKFPCREQKAYYVIKC